MNYKLPLETDETMARFIRCIFHMMKQTLVETKARSAFRLAGLRYDIGRNPYVLLFDENVLRQSPGFTSLWERDCPPDNLSQRRRNAPFGWVNMTMRPDWSPTDSSFASGIWSSRSLLFHLTNAISSNWWMIFEVLLGFSMMANALD
jgi:hypothetical protein